MTCIAVQYGLFVEEYGTKTIHARGGSRIIRRRGHRPSSGGRQHMILLNFPKNCMKLRKIWAGGGLLPGALLDLPLHAKCQEYSVQFFMLHKCLTSLNDINIDKLMFEIGVTLN